MMTVKEWITKHPGLPATLSIHSSIEEILREMLSPPHSRDIYILSDENRPIGHLSLRMLAHHLLPRYLPVHTRRQMIHRVTGITIPDLMNPEFPHADPEEDLEDVFALLLDREIEDLPVMGSEGRMIGKVNLTALLAYLLEKEETDTQCMI